MRTVDPELWSVKAKRHSMKLSRSTRFGQEYTNHVEMRLRDSLRDALREYWANCTVQGVRHIYNGNLTKFETYCYSTLLFLGLCAGLSTTSYCWMQSQRLPQLLVTLQSVQHSSRQIPFPAVALCSNSVINRGPLLNYTMFLDSKDQNNTYHTNAIRRNLLKFGALLTMSLPPTDVMFMQFLTHADPRRNVTRLMQEFSPSCPSILARCSWRGRLVPCERIFAPRATPLGFCCVFNSRYHSEDSKNPPKFLDKIGQDNGLSLVIKENTDDFAYLRRPYSLGLEVLLFDGSEYPLLEGGGVRMYPVQRNSSVYMTLTARVQTTDGENLPGCRARRHDGPRASRSYAWCLTECRRRTLATLCACRLHTLLPDPRHPHPVCSLDHLGCLNKHREKFIYYYPEGHTEASLTEELDNGLFCEDCAPDCSRSLYLASMAVSRHTHDRDNMFKNMIVSGLTMTNATVVSLFYSSDHQMRYSVEAYSRWYETFATISSQWAGIIGASIVSAAELVFHCSLRWVHHFKRRTRLMERHRFHAKL